MKFFASVAAISIFFIQVHFVSACAIATFEPSNTYVESTGKSDAILLWDNGTERLLIDPVLKGDASDFALAFAFPSQPHVEKASQTVFEQLQEYTKPIPVEQSENDFLGMSAGIGAAKSAPSTATPSPVQVLEVRDVGDFTASILTATDTTALINWLQEHDYQFSDDDKANFEYYVSRGGYYFVVLKVQAEEVPAYMRMQGYDFTPIEFRFTSASPFFPLRLARDNDPLQSLRLYTIADTPLVVYGAGVSFAEKLPELLLPSTLYALQPYEALGKWLITMDVAIDPGKIEEDLTPVSWNTPYAVHIFSDQSPVVLYPDLAPVKSGVIPSFYMPPLSYLSPFEEGDFWEQVWLAAAIVLAILLYGYKITTLFFLAKKLNASHRWLAWIPVANIYLYVRLAEKRWWWFAGIVGVPFVWMLGIGLVQFVEGTYYYYSEPYYGAVVAFIIYTVIAPILFEFFLIERVATRIMDRCKKPLWWGLASTLFPPLGLVLFGITAWSKNGEKKIEQQALEAVPPAVPIPQSVSIPPVPVLQEKQKALKKSKRVSSRAKTLKAPRKTSKRYVKKK